MAANASSVIALVITTTAIVSSGAPVSTPRSGEAGHIAGAIIHDPAQFCRPSRTVGHHSCMFFYIIVAGKKNGAGFPAPQLISWGRHL
ncbi:Hypothetical protein GbCGDNIH6_8295 [Granulibacter bethesdensis]|nr:Hypothetical protein GbCGDNIH6_8295 [Granulibacter bethesdensis]